MWFYKKRILGIKISQGFDLNISRYIDTFEEDEKVDINFLREEI